MMNFIPIYPMEAVVYPGNTGRFHIYEDKYKHLITDCFGENRPFGILPVVQKRLAENGTLVLIRDVAEVWTDGRMNIEVEGTQVFHILEIIRDVPGKLYGGAIVSYPDNVEEAGESIFQKVIALLNTIHRMLHTDADLPWEKEKMVPSYTLAAYSCLTLEQEYELLELLFESQRLEYLRRHLVKLLPLVSGLAQMREELEKKNSFRSLKGFDL